MSIALVQEQKKQAELSKSMIPDPGLFDGNKTKLKNWQKEIRLFFKNNRVTEINDKITVIIIYLRKSIARIYAQKKLYKLDKETGICYNLRLDSGCN